MRVVDIKSPPRISTRKNSPPVFRVVRSTYKVPPAAIYKPASKWSVIIAFILSIALHISAVAIVEMQSRQSAVEFADNLNANDRAEALD
jgi:hypothetical protein